MYSETAGPNFVVLLSLSSQLCTVCVQMCAVLLPQCVKPIAVNKHIYTISAEIAPQNRPRLLRSISLIIRIH
jgi:hypothetical protein